MLQLCHATADLLLSFNGLEKKRPIIHLPLCMACFVAVFIPHSLSAAFFFFLGCILGWGHLGGGVKGMGSLDSDTPTPV